MKLQGRNLEPNHKGEDVRLLQDELRQLDFALSNEEGFFGPATFLAVKDFQRQNSLPSTGLVNAATARALDAAIAGQPRNGFVVSGRALHADGSPVTGAVVAVFEKRLRSEQNLGQGVSGDEGRFEIAYPPPPELPISILVRLFDASGNELAASAVICDAAPVEVVTVVVGGETLRGPSEFRQLEQTLGPILATEQVTPADLNDDDIAFLACRFELEEAHLQFYAFGARFHYETQIEAQVFYGLMRQGLPTDLAVLVAQPGDHLSDALQGSLAENIIDADLQTDIPLILRQLSDQIVRLALAEPEPDRPTFASLLNIAGVDSDHHQRILSDYVHREGTVAAFWQQLRDDPAMTGQALDELQTTLQLSAIALNHVDLVSHLTQLRHDGTLGTGLRDLSRLQPAEWRQLLDTEVEGRVIGAPVFFGEDETERIERYAAYLPRMVESLFPTAVLTHRLAEEDHTEFDFRPALAFLNQNPTFEFHKTPLRDYLDAHPGAMSEVPDAGTTVETLRTIERLFEISPAHQKARTIGTLMRHGIQSATAIRRMGPTRFVGEHKTILGLETAQELYTRAARKADTALMLLSQTKLFNPTNPAIIAPHLVGQGVPELEDLFGSLDLCRCEHCNSVYSPAAYLVDMLHFLMNRPSVDNRTALDVLFDRRPDLGEIELTCYNTHTTLPYVDLVLEIMETAVVSGGTLPITGEDGADRFFPFQTAGGPDALGANPEHLNEQAYETVRHAVYPWRLPFDLWYAEVRTYLNHLGVPFAQLMGTFDFAETPNSQAALAAEVLDLTARERQIVTGSGGDTLHHLWGFDDPSELNQFIANRNAGSVLERCDLDYDALVQLLGVHFIDPENHLGIQFEAADCNLDTASISNLDEDALDRIHRFVRLWRRQAWSIPELGSILETLATSEIGDAQLRELATLTQLQAALKAPLPILLNWLHDRMSTSAGLEPLSLYEQVFLDPTVHNPELAIFTLNEDRTELANPMVSLHDHVPITYSALGIHATDLMVLIDADLPGDQLNLANLTRLYQAVSLSKRLQLAIPDYVALLGLSGLNPFGQGAIDQLAALVNLAARIRESAFSMDQLDYLLRHRESGNGTIGPDAGTITAVLVSLREGLYRIALDYLPPTSGDAILQKAGDWLAQVLPGEAMDQLLAVVHGTSDLDQDDQIALVQAHLGLFMDPSSLITVWFDPENETNEEPSLRAALFLEPLAQHLRLIAGEALVIQIMADALNLELAVAEALLTTHVPEPGTDSPSLDLFLAGGFVPPPTPGEEPPELANTTNPDQFPQHYLSFLLLAKIAMVLDAWALTPAGTDFYFTHGTQSGWPDLNALPLEPLDAPQVAPEAFLRVAELFALSNHTFGDLAILFDLLGSLADGPQDLETFLTALAKASAWDQQDLSYLAGPPALDLAYPDDFRDGIFLLELAPRMQLVKKLAVSARVAHGWATEAVTVETARAVKQAARAKHEDKTHWLTVAKPLRDELRARQREALAAYLVHTIRVQAPMLEQPQPTLGLGSVRAAVKELQLRLNIAGAVPPLKVDGIFGPLTREAVLNFQEAHGLTADGIVGAVTWAQLNQFNRRLRGPNELYAHFLVDVEMSPCMLTSRILLANSSVQLFVQRCQLNLEPEVELSPEDLKEWQWMKHYRVWEANRKVFLYPENWIYPELRDDKTPLFKELESGLLQDEINDRTVEREYRKYLNGLNQIAQLEISCIHRQWESNQDILHVVGRTGNAPHLYFYRQWVDQRTWTPWERIDLDIEGDHVFAAMWQRRFYLFWPMFIQKTQEVVVAPDQDPPEPRHFYEIRMVWSDYRDGSWAPKQVSDHFVTSHITYKDVLKSSVAFWPQFDDLNRLYLIHDGLHFTGSKQFRFALGDGRLEVRGENNYKPFPQVPVKFLHHFSGTEPFFNKLKGTGTQQQPLNVITSGSVVHAGGVDILLNVTQAKVLNKAAGSFQIVLPSDDRHFKSRSPFVYFDRQRTFLVVPRGTYSGGFGGGFDEAVAAAAVPLEFPNAVAGSVANYLAGTPARAANVTQDIHPSVIPGIQTVAPTQSPQTASVGPLKWEAKNFRFENHYHPFVDLLIEELNRYGIDGILKPDPEKEKHSQRKNIVESLQRQKRKRIFFNTTYNPTSVVDDPKPVEEFDFNYGGAYAVYNWELFFHAPLMLAKRLSDHRQFAQAHRWFHYIFDPTYQATDPYATSWPERVWQIKPFFQHGVGESIQRTMLLLKSSGLTNAEKKERKLLQDQIEAWRKAPFNPHLIARMRPEAYMKATVMAYLDNLIAWADYLFRQDTMESINEATQLYILADEILGQRPAEIAAHGNAVPTIDGEEVRTFNDLRGHLDAFSNALVALETLVEPDASPNHGGGIGNLVNKLAPTPPDEDPGGFGLDLPLAAWPADPPDDNPPVADVPLAEPIPAVLGPTLFFCIPKNDKLMGYWDTVADRLFKIRHCMNIEGVVRQLPLFQPPIDPGALVKAAAAGVDLSSALNNLNAPMPHYRFQVLQQKAAALLTEVKGLGAALLSALEKRDAETLSLLHANHEIRVQKSVRHIKEKSVEETKANLEALRKTRALTETRFQHYAKLIENGLIKKEQKHLEKLEAAFATQTASQVVELLAGVLGLIPQFDAGVSGAFGTPVVKVEFGGANLSTATQVASRALQLASSVQSYQANKASIEASHDRRNQDWAFQQLLAEKELEQINSQIEAAGLRIAMAEKDLASHDVQTENANEVEAYLKDKFTNPELYSWMLAQVSGIYFQSYQLAYDLAKQAEMAFRYELGIEQSDFIQFGYWDNLKKGLLAGERLQADLHRLEAAYLEENRREFELHKHVSLAAVNPLALLQLKATGRCEVEIPETLFDLDYPGHYFRRIKSVSLTIPAVTGPYTTLSCTLRLLRSSLRRQSTLLNDAYARDQENDDPRFSDRFGAIQSIATSSGQGDSGLFQLSFYDERYLPFEGAGAISRWQLEMPNQLRQFDYDSISDVILHVHYTAREGGNLLRSAAETHLIEAANALVTGDHAPGLLQSFSARHAFPTAFHRFMHPVADADPQVLNLDLTPNHFPHMFRERTLLVDQVFVFIQLADDFVGADATATTFTLNHPGGEEVLDLATATASGNLRHLSIDGLNSAPGPWTLSVTGVSNDLATEQNQLNALAVEDIVIVLHYTLTD